jgi:hypothetical protein
MLYPFSQTEGIQQLGYLSCLHYPSVKQKRKCYVFLNIQYWYQVVELIYQAYLPSAKYSKICFIQVVYIRIVDLNAAECRAVNPA